ncbi:MAG: hypothetical protein V3U35_08415 [Candidatus Neomarinimicrobiota bacterium]
MAAKARRFPALLLAAGLMVPALLPAQRDITGRTWTQWDPDWKVVYLMGFYAAHRADGELLRQAERDHPNQDPTQYEPTKLVRYRKERSEYSARDLKYNFTLIRDLTDVFYTDPDNLLIPVPEALRILMLRDAGDAKRADFLLLRERRATLKGK